MAAAIPPMRLLETEDVLGCMIFCVLRIARCGAGRRRYSLPDGFSFSQDQNDATHIKQVKLPAAGSKQGLFVFREELVVDVVEVCAVEDAVTDDGVPFNPGIELGIGGLLEQTLGLLQ